MKFILIALLAVVCINAITTEESFKLWMSKHNKNYNNDAEFSYRLGVYRSNLEFVEEHNKMQKSYTVALNQFADLSGAEFAELYNGLNIDAAQLRQSGDAYTHDGLHELAATVDWRNKGVVTAVKNQGQCGSCWAFSTTGSTEGQTALKTGKLVSLSEQNLVDCSGSYGNAGCNGGLMDSAFKYIIANGIDTEASYPYTAQDGNCKFNSANIGARLSSFRDVQSGSESSLTSAIQSVGPISVAIDASHSSFQFYSGGVYNEPACSSTQLDHGVLAVGYGTESGSDYYIVKNSWGTSWGMSGYILMSRNANNQCGIATMASYPIV